MVVPRDTAGDDAHREECVEGWECSKSSEASLCIVWTRASHLVPSTSIMNHIMFQFKIWATPKTKAEPKQISYSPLLSFVMRECMCTTWSFCPLPQEYNGDFMQDLIVFLFQPPFLHYLVTCCDVIHWLLLYASLIKHNKKSDMSVYITKVKGETLEEGGQSHPDICCRSNDDMLLCAQEERTINSVVETHSYQAHLISQSDMCGVVQLIWALKTAVLARVTQKRTHTQIHSPTSPYISIHILSQLMQVPVYVCTFVSHARKHNACCKKES